MGHWYMLLFHVCFDPFLEVETAYMMLHCLDVPRGPGHSAHSAPNPLV
jgi:hypothetical protein